MKSLDEFDAFPAWESPPRGDTGITVYLRDIGRVKRLSSEEEIELAARIRKMAREARADD